MVTIETGQSHCICSAIVGCYAKKIGIFYEFLLIQSNAFLSDKVVQY